MQHLGQARVHPLALAGGHHDELQASLEITANRRARMARSGNDTTKPSSGSSASGDVAGERRAAWNSPPERRCAILDRWPSSRCSTRRAGSARRRPRSTCWRRSRSAGSARSPSTSTRRATCRTVFGARPRRAEDSLCGFFLQQRGARRYRADHPQRRRALSGAPRPRQARRAGSARASTQSPGCARGCTSAGAVPGPVVIDCCALLNVLSLNAIFACDLMLVPVSCDYLALGQRARGRTRAQCAGAGVRSVACHGATCSRATTPGAG